MEVPLTGLDGRNPYLGGGLVESYVVYMDVLGFSGIVEAETRAGRGNALLQRVIACMREARELIDPEKNRFSRYRPDECCVRFFTDNVVLGFPIRDKRGELELVSALSSASAYQFTLSQHGFAARGGLAYGLLYMDETIVLGPGLLRAHELDQHGSPPRVMLHGDVLERLRQYSSEWRGELPYSGEIWVDREDGSSFVNYLDAVDVFPERGMTTSDQDVALLLRHKDWISDGLGTSDLRTRRKYAWLADYHNRFCALWYPGLSTLQVPGGIRREVREQRC